MKERIVVIGAGRIGQAVVHVCTRKGHHVDTWDVVPGLVPNQQSLEVLIPRATGVILCIPSWTTRASVLTFRDVLPKSAFVLSFAKGIEVGSRKTVDAVLAELLPKHATGVIGGPMMAEEILSGKGGIAAIGTAKRVFPRVRSLFAGTDISVQLSADIRGVAYAGTLKNVYAFALGVAAGAGWGENMRGWLAARAVGEMVAILSVLGSEDAIAFGPAGVGDFVATAFSPHSRNRSVGEKAIKTGKCPESEATRSIPSLCAILGAKKVKTLPILAGLSGTLAGKRTFRKMVEDWRALASKAG